MEQSAPTSTAVDAKDLTAATSQTHSATQLPATSAIIFWDGEQARGVAKALRAAMEGLAAHPLSSRHGAVSVDHHLAVAYERLCTIEHRGTNRVLQVLDEVQRTVDSTATEARDADAMQRLSTAGR